MGDDEIAFMTRIGSGGLFLDAADKGETRAAFELDAQLRMLLRCGKSVDFHAAIAQIADIAGGLQLLGSGLREVAKAHSLNHARHEVTLG